MRSASRLPFAVLLTLASASAVFAQQPQQQPAPPPATQPAAQPPAEQTPEQNPDQPQKYEEVVVVTASKTEEKLINAPATMTVINSQTIQSAPTQNFAELLRAVPGVNITQVSARDINVTARGATSTLATGQLALLDGRSLYQDFFGFVMWDFLPVNLNEVKQVEVISGPASAVWGANALYGVVNVITKSPREMQGAAFTMGVGGFDRSTNDSAESAGTVFYISGTYAQAVNDRWAYKLSAGGYMQDAMPRPTGTIPCDMPEVCKGPKNPYPAVQQPGDVTAEVRRAGRLRLRERRETVVLGWSGRHQGDHGIGHRAVRHQQRLGDGLRQGELHSAGLSCRFLLQHPQRRRRQPADARSAGQADRLHVQDATYDFEASNVQTFRQKHVVTYGGNLRFNTFDLSLAPAAQNRTEGGGYIQDEIFLSNRYRLVAGARVDRFDYLDSFVFSPRVTFMIKPHEDQTVRVSYNRAYRSPSVINNFLDVIIAEPIDLSPFAPLNPALKGQIYPLPVRSVGNPQLQETSMDAFEVGYTGVVAHGKAVVTAAVYVNRIRNDILFTEDLSKRYGPTNPPPGWPLPPFTLGRRFFPAVSRRNSRT